MSLLALVGDAMVMAGFSRPSSVYSNSDPNVQEFLTWSQVEGDDLALLDWPQLKVLLTLTGDGSSTTYTLATDFARWDGGQGLFIDGESNGPLVEVTDEQMRAYKAAAISPTRPVWRRFGDQIEFYPAPASTETIKGEYRSQYWIVDSGLTTRKATWDADDNEPLLPNAVLKYGITWRWKRSKGLFYDDLKNEYERLKMLHFSHQTGRKNLRIPTIYPSDMPLNLAEPKITVV